MAWVERFLTSSISEYIDKCPAYEPAYHTDDCGYGDRGSWLSEGDPAYEYDCLQACVHGIRFQSIKLCMKEFVKYLRAGP
jgi:hypothetical protein